jgi:hypothetical protein
MYQQNNKFNLNYLENPEKEFDNLYKLFLKSADLDEKILNSNKTNFDLNKKYIINHACIWNKTENFNKECVIVQKNDKIALIVFENDFELTLDKFYRLEDLTEIN